MLGNGGSTAGGKGDGKNGVGAEPGFVGGAVERNHTGIDGGLVAGVVAAEFWGDAAVDVGDRAGNTAALVPACVTIAKFECFIDAGRGTRGDRGTAEGTVGELDIGFDGGAAARVEDFAGADGADAVVLHVSSLRRNGQAGKWILNLRSAC